MKKPLAKPVTKPSRADAEKALSLMFEMGRVIRRACLADEAAALPLSYLETLRFVGDEEHPTMRDIAGYLRVTAPSATAIVEALAKDGLLSRREDPKDRRLVRLSLSKKGEGMLKKTFSTRLKALRGILGTLDAEDTRQFIKILSILITNNHGK